MAETLTVSLHSAAELAEFDPLTLDRMLGCTRSAQARLDGNEALLISALEKAERRPRPDVPKPGARGGPAPEAPPSTDDGPTDDADPSTPPEPSTPARPPVSARGSRQARERARRLQLHPDVRNALAAGQITTEQADLLTNNELPAADVSALLAEAENQTTDETRAAVREAVRASHQGNAKDRLDRQRRNRRGSCGVDDDGMVWFSARLDPVTGAPIKEEFDRRENRQFHADLEESDRWKRRTATQRGADVIAELLGNGTLKRENGSMTGGSANAKDPRPASEPGADPGAERRTSASRTGTAGTSGRIRHLNPRPAASSKSCSCAQDPPVRPSLSLIADLETLSSADTDAVAFTADGVAVPTELARASLCVADITFWFTNTTRTELFLGRNVELATPAIKQALLVRDGSCRWRGCTVEASRCEAHHLTFRREGGLSDPSNFALLCPRHHVYLHSIGAHLRMGHTADHWKLVDDRTGKAIDEWTMPTPRTARPPNRSPDDEAA